MPIHAARLALTRSVTQKAVDPSFFYSLSAPRGTSATRTPRRTQMVFWRYTVCIGGDAHQWHAEAGTRTVEHNIGSAQAQRSELNRQIFGGGHAGRSAELLLFCWEAPSWHPRGYSLVVHETRPLQYQMTLFHPAACATRSSPPAAHGLPHLWGECFESVLSDTSAHELRHPLHTSSSHATWRSSSAESSHTLPHLRDGERRTVPPGRPATARAGAADAATALGSDGGGSGEDGRGGRGGGQRGSGGKGGGDGKRGEEVGRGDSAQLWPRHLQVCTE